MYGQKRGHSVGPTPEFWKIAKSSLDGSPRRRLARLERVCEQGFCPCGPEVLDAQMVHQPVVSTRDTHAAESRFEAAFGHGGPCSFLMIYGRSLRLEVVRG